jgi:hypothetical protein
MCNTNKTVLLIGEIFVDVHLDILQNNKPVVRIGGIFHSARGLAALKTSFALAYFAPEYLEKDINYYSCHLCSKGSYKIGNITKAPNVMLVRESKEQGDQGYENLLREQIEYEYLGNTTEIIRKVTPSDILIYPGKYDVNKILNELKNCSANIHIDMHYDSDGILENIENPVDTVIISTSSKFFHDKTKDSLNELKQYFKDKKVKRILIKENRGGSYYFDMNGTVFEAPAYCVSTAHSVGVGDVYNSVFLSGINGNQIDKSMNISSLISALYAKTLSYEEFKNEVRSFLDRKDEKCSYDYVRLSWEEKKDKNIYLAAPDFPNVDTSLLKKLFECLKYHGFNPHLPIKENGLVKEDTTPDERYAIYCKDVELLKKCDLLIAVLLFNDPGTLVEIGQFKEMGKPVIIFDPYNICTNLFLLYSTSFICKSIDEVISKTYISLRRNVQ